MKHKKPARLLTVLLAVTVMLSGTLIPGLLSFAADSIFTGSGTESDPYLVETPSQLKNMVESGGNGKYYKLVNDIAVNDTSADNWYEQENLTQWIYTVNGNWDYCFYGTIDGGGHTVTGLYNNLNDSNIAYCGFISVLHDKGPTVIRNLKIDRSYFRVNNNEGETHIGTFVGAMNGRNLTLENCAVGEDVTIFCKTKDGDPMIGGFVGSLGGSGSFTATNCLTDFADGDAETSGAPSWDPGTPCQPRIGSLYGKAWGAQIKVNNVLSTGLKLQGNESTGNNAVINGGFTTVNLEDTIGEKAKTTLTGFDFDFACTWATVENGYPTLSIFNGQPEKGTAENPIIITTASQLRSMVESGGKGKYYKLANDIAVNDTSADNWYEQDGLTQWLSNSQWDGQGFQGTIDGDGHTVTGLYNRIETSGVKYFGFLPQLTGTTVIRNLKIDRAYFSVKGNNEMAVGTFVGNEDAKDLTLENCAVGENVIIRCESTNGNQMIGGFVGALGGSGTLTVTDCLTDFVDGEGATAGSWEWGDHQVQIGSLFGNGWGINIAANNVLSTGLKLSGSGYWTDAAKNAVINGSPETVSLDSITGGNAVKILTGFDFDTVWQTVENDYPILLTFRFSYTPRKGTAENPITISTKEELMSIVKSGGNGRCYRLTNDIAVNDTTDPEWYTKDGLTQWLTERDISDAFRGVIDGGGHTITGLYNKAEISDDGNFYGFLPKLGGTTTIQNLTIDRCWFYRSNTESETFIGAFVGSKEQYDLNLYNCTAGADITITVNAVTSNQGIGGFIGSINGSGQTVLKNVVTKFVNGSGTTSGAVSWDPDNPCKVYIGSVFGMGWSSSRIWAYNLDATGMAASGNGHYINIQNNCDEGVRDRVWQGGIATEYAGGSGTEDDPFLIETPEQMAFLMSQTFEYNSAMEGQYFKLTADLKLNDTSKADWQKTARQWFAGRYFFNGHFDGDGHIVSGLYYNGDVQCAGLFSFVTVGSSVKNIGVTQSTVISTPKNEGDETFAAAIAGGSVYGYASSEEEKEKAFFSNCFADTSVYLEGMSASGIVCFGSEPVKMENCYFTGTLNYDYSKKFGGGLMGCNWVKNNEVRNCYVATNDRDTALANFDADNATVENVYVDGPINRVFSCTLLNTSAMFGKNAVRYMTGFDFDNVWQTVEGGTPVLRIFGSDAYSCKRDPYKTSITFATRGGSKCETVYGIPRMDRVPELPTPVRYGYIFDGWYFDLDFYLPVNLDVFPDYNITIYPKWIETGFSNRFEDSVDRTYDVNGSVRHYRPGLDDYSMTYVHGGMKSLHCMGDTGIKPVFLLSYENKLTVGKIYELTFWMTTDMDKASGEIQLIHTYYPDVNDEIFGYQSGVKFTGLKNGDWKQYSITFAAGAPYILIQTPEDTSLYFDDIQVIDTGKSGAFTGTRSSVRLNNTVSDREDENGNLVYTPNQSGDGTEDPAENTQALAKEPTKRKKIKRIVTVYNGLPTAAIVGICVGGAVLAAAIVTVIIMLVKKHRKKQKTV